jgi:outer membrane protein assembly factor BamB
MKQFCRGVLAVFALALAHTHAYGADTRIAGWRGDGSGRFPNATPPTEWSETKNIRWRTQIGANKFSSPVLAAGRIYVTADPAWLVCVNAADGKILWKKSNDFSDLPEKSELTHRLADAGNTAPTPVSDGDSVFALFGSGIVACYERDGARRWIRHFRNKPTPEYGRATSPILVGGKLLVTLSHLLALDPRSGRELWENKSVPESYGTPLAAKLDGVDVLVMPSGQIVRLADGRLLATELGGLKFASPIVHDGAAFFIQTGSAAHRFSGADAARWSAKTFWEQELEGTFYASPVWHDGLIYTVANEYKFHILDARDGKLLALRDLEFPAPKNSAPASNAAAPNMYPSLVAAGNFVFAFNDAGDALVLKPGKTFHELRRNHLGEGHGGTPVFDGHRIYLRSGAELFCISDEAKN